MRGRPQIFRQRMINLMYLIFIAMLALNVSSEVLDGFEWIQDSLRATIKNTETRNMYLEDALAKYDSAGISFVSQKLKEIRIHADSLYSFIEQLKLQIALEADGINGDPYNIKRKDDLDAASRVMLATVSGQGKVLRKAIDSYREHLLENTDDSFLEEIISSGLTTHLAPQKGVTRQNWEIGLFENIPVSAAITMLTKLQSDIRYVEGEVILHIFDSMQTSGLISVWVLPDNPVVLQGNNFTGRVFISPADSNAMSEYYIDGKKIGRIGLDYFSLPATSIGRHTIEGEVVISGKTGSLRKLPFTTEYIVTEPVSFIENTQMNVLYAGYDNQLSMGLPGVAGDKILTTVSSGLIRRVSSHLWTIRPEISDKNVVITVGAEGVNPIRKNFRVIPLPDPIAYIDLSSAGRFKGGSITNTQLLSADSLSAGYEEKLLDVSFMIRGFDMVWYDSFGNMMQESSGNSLFTERQRKQIRDFRSGKSFYLTRIRAIGDDGNERSLSPVEIIIK